MCQDGWSRWDAPEKVGDTAQDLPDRWIWDLSSPERRCWQQGQRVQVCGWVSPSRILGFGSKFQLFPLVLSLQEERDQPREAQRCCRIPNSWRSHWLCQVREVPGTDGAWSRVQDRDVGLAQNVVGTGEIYTFGVELGS